MKTMKQKLTAIETLNKELARINKIWKEDLKCVFPQYCYNGSSKKGEQVLKMRTMNQVIKFCNENNYDDDYTEHMVRRWFITQIQKVDYLLFEYIANQMQNVSIVNKRSREIVLKICSKSGSYFETKFKLRTTRMPAKFNFTDVYNNPQYLLDWLYSNGRTTGRTSNENRIYLISDNDEKRLDFKTKAISILESLSMIQYYRCNTPNGTYTAIPIFVK